jgi:drug/metabolite transporter (DMT)-like permease
MNEPHTTVAPSRPAASAPAGRGGRVRPTLWVLLVISLVGNGVMSLVNTPAGIAFGLVAMACVAGLVVNHRASRRQ